MNIIVGSYRLEAVTNFLAELKELLPAGRLLHKEFASVFGVREVGVDLVSAPGLNRGLRNDRLLAALIDKTITCAICSTASLSDDLPDEIDYFTLPLSFLRAGNENMFAADAVDDSSAVEAAEVDSDDHLTMLFQRGDEIMPVIRNLLLPPVVFAGAGIGGVDNVTLGVMNTLTVCDICVYDALIPEGILEFLPVAAEKIFVGKRSGRHYMKQDEINRLLVRLGKSGKKVVRLKGGDPSIFGRLAEEVGALRSEQLQFRVLPGITSLNVAAAGSGLLPSRRGVNRGFTISTPRRAGSHSFVPLSLREQKESFNVYYMAANLVPEIVKTLQADGFASDWPISLVFDAGSWDEMVVCGTLSDIVTKVDQPELKSRPALVLTGEGAGAGYLFQTNAPLEKRKIICCGDDRKLFKAAKNAIENFGGRPLFVESLTVAAGEIEIFKQNYDAIIFLEEKSRQIFLDKPGSAALTGKVAAAVSNGSCLLPESAVISITAADIQTVCLRLAACFSNCKIETLLEKEQRLFSELN